MGHHHDHHHGHDHDHDHHHGDHDHDHHHGDHDHNEAPPLGLEDKLARLLSHWAKHNREHAQSYRDWAAQSRKAGLGSVAERLEAVAAQTLRIAEQLEDGLK